MALMTTTRRIGNVTVVDCAGRIVLGDESKALRALVKDLLSEAGQIVLDLGDVTYIDSSGLGTLVGLHTSAQQAGGNIRLARLNSRIIELLQTTRLLTVFETHDTAEKAAAAFTKAAGAA